MFGGKWPKYAIFGQILIDVDLSAMPKFDMPKPQGRIEFAIDKRPPKLRLVKLGHG
jgi:hypothetical protein